MLAARLLRRAKSVAAALEEAGPVYVPERLHDVRISTKKLRYALEIARDAGVAAATSLVRVLKRHQERLGHLHDLQMLLKHVRETEASPGVGSRVNDLTAYADSLDRECRRLHAAFVEHRAELAVGREGRSPSRRPGADDPSPPPGACRRRAVGLQSARDARDNASRSSSSCT